MDRVVSVAHSVVVRVWTVLVVGYMFVSVICALTFGFPAVYSGIYVAQFVGGMFPWVGGVGEVVVFGVWFFILMALVLLWDEGDNPINIQFI